MTPTDLHTLLRSIGWSRQHLADRLGYASEKSLRQWKTVPPRVVAYVQAVHAAIKKIECPKISVDMPEDRG